MRVLVLLLVFAAVVAPSGLQASGEEMSNVESSLRNLKSDLLNQKVTSVRVLFAPYKLLTRVPLTPQLLPGSAEINRLVEVNQSMRASLLVAIDKTKTSPLDSPPDLRWGAIFYGSKGTELHSIYLNGKFLFGTGRQGIIDGNSAKLNGALIKWFEDTFDRLTPTPAR